MKHYILIALSFLCLKLQAQVQLFGYKDYSMPYNINIGAGKIKPTHPSAYLELGDSVFSKKGFLPPRGWKDSVQSPVKGLQIYDVPTNQLWWHNGTAWQQAAKPAVDSIYRTGGIVYYKKEGVTYNLGENITTPDHNLKYTNGVLYTNKAPASLIYGATTVWDVSLGYNRSLTLSGNTILSIINAQAGSYYKLTVVQDATGGRTITFPPGSLMASGTITLSTAGGAKDILMAYYDGTNYYWVIGKDFK